MRQAAHDLLAQALSAISDVRRSYRSIKNTPYAEPFVEWIEGFAYEPYRLYGMNTQQELVALGRKKG